MNKKLLAYLKGNYLYINDYCQTLLSSAKKEGRIIKGAFNGVIITASPIHNIQDLLDTYWNEIARRNNPTDDL
jgi:homoserine trans-succinylase